MACLAYTGKEDGEEDDMAATDKQLAKMPQIPLSVNRVHDIIESMKSSGKGAGEDADLHHISDTLVKSVSLGATMWELQSEKNATSGTVDKSSYVPPPPESTQRVDDGTASEALKHRRPRAKLLSPTGKARYAEWKEILKKSPKAPTLEQWRVLDNIYARIWQEQLEHKQGKQRTSLFESLRMLIQGLPGSGKSQLITWIRCLFEEVLGWCHGREFVCIAAFNTMAALIGGFTVHSWGETGEFLLMEATNVYEFLHGSRLSPGRRGRFATLSKAVLSSGELPPKALLSVYLPTSIHMCIYT